ncbi:MAG: histidine kinase [Aquificaceae bacterium]|nr:histidine kinase [Aquificaceae bacterium]MDW8237098.1 histidine kinase [Aquificaceae bacterium]
MVRVRPREWFYILLLALVLGLSIAGFSASLFDENLMSLMGIGALTAIYIFLLSLILTELINAFLLPRLPTKLHTPLSFIFAFLAGFTGSLLGYFTKTALKMSQMHVSYTKAIELSIFLGLITASLGYLIYKLILSQRQQEQSEKLLLEAHLRNLENQISPHFLFNTLNAITELIHSDPNKAEDALMSFSRLLRKGLYLEPFITLREELSLINDYWQVISLRFHSKIELIVSAQPELLELKLPKFSLQILVENALKHGLNMRSGKVEILAKRQNGNATVCVIDNGKGFESLNPGIGLTNLIKRLETIGAKLEYSSNPGTTRFCILLDEKKI